MCRRWGWGCPLILTFSPEGEKEQRRAGLGGLERPVGGGDDGKHGKLLNRAGYLFNPVVYGAGADLHPAGVGLNVGEGIRLPHTHQEVVKLAVLGGDGGVDEVEGAAGFGAGRGFIRAKTGDVGEVAGADRAGQVFGVVGFILVQVEVGHVALLLFAGHKGEHGVGDMAAGKAHPAGLVEILGASAEVFVDEKVEGFVHHDGAVAEAVTPKAAAYPCA